MRTIMTIAPTAVFEAYIRSAKRFKDIARQAGADIVLSNHTLRVK
jgi:hypothetical protein